MKLPWRKILLGIGLVGIFVTIIFGFGVGNLVQAQELDLGLNAAKATGLNSTSDIRTIIARIIQVFLGLLGIIAISLILYAGFKWMTAQGNEKQIEEAKKILLNAVIGLAIILSAFALASFIINQLLKATGNGAGGPPSEPCTAEQAQKKVYSGCYLCKQTSDTESVTYGWFYDEYQTGCGSDDLKIIAYYPPNDKDKKKEQPMNVKPRISFNYSLRVETVTSDTIKIQRVEEEKDVNNVVTLVPVETVVGTLSVDSGETIVLFTPNKDDETTTEKIENNCLNDKGEQIYADEAIAIKMTGCLAANSIYQITVDSNSVKANNGKKLVCPTVDGFYAKPCSSIFITGDGVDLVSPTVFFNQLFPTEGGLPISPVENGTAIMRDGDTKTVDSFDLYAKYSDDFGVAEVHFNQQTLDPKFYVAGLLEGEKNGETQYTKFSKDSSAWDINIVPYLSRPVIAVDVVDGAGNSSKIYSAELIVRPAHCFNTELDGAGDSDLDKNDPKDKPEVKVDCGQDTYCGGCVGDPCSKTEACTPDNSACSTVYCSDTCYCDKVPRIFEFTPNGQPRISKTEPTRNGTLVTIHGMYFGDYVEGKSQVFFGVEGNWIEARLARAVHTQCQDNWSDSQIIVETPEIGDSFGYVEKELNTIGIAYIKVKGFYGPDDKGNDLYKEVMSATPFIFDHTTRPGLCAFINPYGSPENTVNAYGASLPVGDELNDAVYFGTDASKVKADEIKWNDMLNVTFNVPNLKYSTETKTNVFVRDVDSTNTTSYQDSNSLYFNFIPQAKGDKPVISSITPESGPQGQMITISGKNFGTNGTVKFYYSKDTKLSAAADVALNPQCTSWSDTQIVVKVPAGTYDDNTQTIYLDKHNVQVVSSSNNNGASNDYPFTITVEEAGPGICGMTAKSAPWGTTVGMYGENFGTEKGTNDYIEFADKVKVLDAGYVAYSDFPVWSSTKIGLQVPAKSQTGNIFLSNDSKLSNPYYFEVKDCRTSGVSCEEGGECCTDGTCAGETGCVKGPDNYTAWEFFGGEKPQQLRVVEKCSGMSNDAGEVVLSTPSPVSSRTETGEVCINAEIAMIFNQVDLNAEEIKDNLEIYECDNLDSTLKCDSPVPFYNPSSDRNLVLVTEAPAGQKYTNVRYWPASTKLFSPDKYYLVILRSLDKAKPAVGIKTNSFFTNNYLVGNCLGVFDPTKGDASCNVSSIGVNAGKTDYSSTENKTEQGGDYVWYFKTRNSNTQHCAKTKVAGEAKVCVKDADCNSEDKCISDAFCKIDGVNVSPAAATFKYLNQEEDYVGDPTSKDAVCYSLNGLLYPWEWALGEFLLDPTNKKLTQLASGYAVVSEKITPQTVVQAKKHTAPNQAKAIGTVTDFDSKKYNNEVEGNTTGQFVIDFIDPYITKVWPTCQTACSNADVGVQFNDYSFVLPSSIKNSNASIVDGKHKFRLFAQYCGNGKVEAGEDCDDGNQTPKDGCSANCLNEGTQPCISGQTGNDVCCGNNEVNMGEECDADSEKPADWPAWCNKTTCLRDGDALSICNSLTTTNCCGDGQVQKFLGEECERPSYTTVSSDYICLPEDAPACGYNNGACTAGTVCIGGSCVAPLGNYGACNSLGNCTTSDGKTGSCVVNNGYSKTCDVNCQDRGMASWVEVPKATLTPLVEEVEEITKASIVGYTPRPNTRYRAVLEGYIYHCATTEVNGQLKTCTTDADCNTGDKCIVDQIINTNDEGLDKSKLNFDSNNLTCVDDNNYWCCEQLNDLKNACVGADGNTVPGNCNIVCNNTQGLTWDKNQNQANAFAWEFTYQDNANSCAVDRVSVLPKMVVMNLIGAVSNYFSFPYSAPDACDASGQMLNNLSYNWVWSSKLPCVSSCLRDPKVNSFDQFIACINGSTCRGTSEAIDATDAYYSCVFNTCKNATSGEQTCFENCDEKNGSGTPVASVTNLNNLPKCDNGFVEKGEECDVHACAGGEKKGLICADDADCGGGYPCVAPGVDQARSVCDGGTKAGVICAQDSDCPGEKSAGVFATCTAKPGNPLCTADCLNSAAVACTATRTALCCGNSIVEPGEDCDQGIGSLGQEISGDGCYSCQHTGSQYCGNGQLEYGEDGDDGNSSNGDGCSNRCLSEGSKADSFTDPFQVATAEGVLPGQTTSYTNITAAATKSDTDLSKLSEGYGTLVMACGYKFDNECQAECDDYRCATVDGESTSTVKCFTRGNADPNCKDPVYPSCQPSDKNKYCGVASNTCCGERPNIVYTNPGVGDEDVCRNALVAVGFDRDMNTSSFTKDTVQVTRYFDKTNGGVEAQVCQYSNTLINKFCNKTMGGISDVDDYVTPEQCDSADGTCEDDVVCPVWATQAYPLKQSTVDGSTCAIPIEITPIDSRKIAVTPLDKNKNKTLWSAGVEYGIILYGGKEGTGITSAKGISYSNSETVEGEYKWFFTAGQDICAISDIEVTIAPPDLTRGYPVGTSVVKDSDLFTCIERLNCLNDQNLFQDGNQHKYSIQAYTSDSTATGGVTDKVEVMANYTWNAGETAEGGKILQIDDYKACVLAGTFCVDAGDCKTPGDSCAVVTDKQTKWITPYSTTGFVGASVNTNLIVDAESPFIICQGGKYNGESCATKDDCVEKACYYQKKEDGKLVVDVDGNPVMVDSGEMCFDDSGCTAGDPDGDCLQKTGVTEYACASVSGKFTKTVPVDVFLCDTPWPAIGQFDWIPTTPEYNYKFVPREQGYNYWFSYCRDNGDVGTADDLPALEFIPVVPNDAKVFATSEYLLINPATDQTIGVRIFNNPDHRYISEWYADTNNIERPGAPTAKTVDGYAALQDGRTIYVNATNIVDTDGDGIMDSADSVNNKPADQIYTYIYLFSYSSNSDSTMKNIYDQILANVKFNTNMAFQDAGKCAASKNLCSSDFDCPGAKGDICVIEEGHCSGNAGVSCNSDAMCEDYGKTCIKDKATCDLSRVDCKYNACPYTKESCVVQKGHCSFSDATLCTSNSFCESIEPGATCINDVATCSVSNVDCTKKACPLAEGDVCLNDKAKLQRDMTRVSDLFKINKALDNYYYNSSPSTYPLLSGGTYVSGSSYSLWPSWQATLANELGTGLPVDPVNTWQCQVPKICEQTGIACSSDANCSRTVCVSSEPDISPDTNKDGVPDSFKYCDDGKANAGDTNYVTRSYCEDKKGYCGEYCKGPNQTTCWDESSLTFFCPFQMTGTGPSYIYSYHVLNGGKDAQVGMSLEYGTFANWSQPGSYKINYPTGTITSGIDCKSPDTHNPLRDSDGDRYFDTAFNAAAQDNCPFVPNGDCTVEDGKYCDQNGDGDLSDEEKKEGVVNGIQTDKDLDGLGDACDVCEGAKTYKDEDRDGVCYDSAFPLKEGNDNCHTIYNPDQVDGNNNKVGDVCDDDADGDGYNKYVDCDDYAGDDAASKSGINCLSNTCDLDLGTCSISGNSCSRDLENPVACSGSNVVFDDSFKETPKDPIWVYGALTANQELMAVLDSGTIYGGGTSAYETIAYATKGLNTSLFSAGNVLSLKVRLKAVDNPRTSLSSTVANVSVFFNIAVGGPRQNVIFTQTKDLPVNGTDYITWDITLNSTESLHTALVDAIKMAKPVFFSWSYAENPNAHTESAYTFVFDDAYLGEFCGEYGQCVIGHGSCAENIDCKNIDYNDALCINPSAQETTDECTDSSGKLNFGNNIDNDCDGFVYPVNYICSNGKYDKAKCACTSGDQTNCDTSIDPGTDITKNQVTVADCKTGGGRCTPYNLCLYDDKDGDGYVTINDCNDNKSEGENINPGELELCGTLGTPGVDENCNGLVDYEDYECEGAPATFVVDAVNVYPPTAPKPLNTSRYYQMNLIAQFPEPTRLGIADMQNDYFNFTDSVWGEYQILSGTYQFTSALQTNTTECLDSVITFNNNVVIKKVNVTGNGSNYSQVTDPADKDLFVYKVHLCSPPTDRGKVIFDLYLKPNNNIDLQLSDSGEIVDDKWIGYFMYGTVPANYPTRLFHPVGYYNKSSEVGSVVQQLQMKSVNEPIVLPEVSLPPGRYTARVKGEGTIQSADPLGMFEVYFGNKTSLNSTQAYTSPDYYQLSCASPTAQSRNIENSNSEGYQGVACLVKPESYFTACVGATADPAVKGKLCYYTFPKPYQDCEKADAGAGVNSCTADNEDLNKTYYENLYNGYQPCTDTVSEWLSNLMRECASVCGLITIGQDTGAGKMCLPEEKACQAGQYKRQLEGSTSASEQSECLDVCLAGDSYETSYGKISGVDASLTPPLDVSEIQDHYEKQMNAALCAPGKTCVSYKSFCFPGVGCPSSVYEDVYFQTSDIDNNPDNDPNESLTVNGKDFIDDSLEADMNDPAECKNQMCATCKAGYEQCIYGKCNKDLNVLMYNYEYIFGVDHALVCESVGGICDNQMMADNLQKVCMGANLLPDKKGKICENVIFDPLRGSRYLQNDGYNMQGVSFCQYGVTEGKAFNSTYQNVLIPCDQCSPVGGDSANCSECPQQYSYKQKPNGGGRDYFAYPESCEPADADEYFPASEFISQSACENAGGRCEIGTHNGGYVDYIINIPEKENND